MFFQITMSLGILRCADSALNDRRGGAASGARHLELRAIDLDFRMEQIVGPDGDAV